MPRKPKKAPKTRTAVVRVLRREQVDSSAQVRVTGADELEVKKKAMEAANAKKVPAADWVEDGRGVEYYEVDEVKWE